MRKLFRHYQLVLYIMVCTCMSACAIMPDAEREAKEQEVSAAHNLWIAHCGNFLTDMRHLLHEIDLLGNYPGWPDMVKIIKAEPSIRYLEGESEAQRKTMAAITDWSRTWDAQGGKIYQYYLSLVERCSILESRRTALLHEWGRINVELIALALSSKSPSMLLELYNQEDERNRGVLNSYVINSLGLYEVDVQKLRKYLPAIQ